MHVRLVSRANAVHGLQTTHRTLPHPRFRIAAAALDGDGNDNNAVPYSLHLRQDSPLECDKNEFINTQINCHNPA